MILWRKKDCGRAGSRSRLWNYAEEAPFADYPFFLPHAPFERILSFKVQIVNPNPFGYNV